MNTACKPKLSNCFEPPQNTRRKDQAGIDGGGVELVRNAPAYVA